MSVTTLAEIGLKAVEYKNAVLARKLAVEKLGAACHRWKQAHGVNYVERHSDVWHTMMDSLDEMTSVHKAKAAERNARERLFRACRRVQA